MPDTQKMSIRLRSDGHSFPAEQLEQALKELRKATEDGTTEGLAMELLAPKSMLVPREYFRPEEAESLLQWGGMPLAPEECVAYSDPAAEIIAVMAIDSATYRRLPSGVKFTSPLLHQPALDHSVVWMAIYGDLLYVKVYTDRLALAEVVHIETEADLLYYTSRLEACFPLKQKCGYFGGERPKSIRKTLHKLFKKSLCE